MGLLSALGGLVGLAFGGPMGAALGSGIGTLASGGDIGDALKSGLMGYGIGSIPGVAGMAAKGAGAMGMQGMAGQFAAQQASQQALMSKAMPGIFGQAASGGINPAAAASAKAAQGGMSQGLGGLFSNPENLILASLIQGGEPKPTPLTPLQMEQQRTGERTPGYSGTAAPDMRRMNMGGYIEGPGTGKSDSIPAMIYQNGGPVQEARLSDGEFVMTADAVRGAGDGSRSAGAAKMYEMMNRFEGMA
jgi:hypothetical protein